MSRGRLGQAWAEVAAVIRSISLTMVGQEPPLAVFIPPEFVPKTHAAPELTPEQKAQVEEQKRKLAAADHAILAALAAQGKPSRVRRGTR